MFATLHELCARMQAHGYTLGSLIDAESLSDFQFAPNQMLEARPSMKPSAPTIAFSRIVDLEEEEFE